MGFSFIYGLCAPLYCQGNGRPAIDPEILSRMLLMGYLYGSKPGARLEEEIFNGILRQCVAKGLVGGAILYTGPTHIKAKADKHKKKLVEVAVTPKAYLGGLEAQVDQEREGLGKSRLTGTTTLTRVAGAPRGCRVRRARRADNRAGMGNRTGFATVDTAPWTASAMWS